METFLPSIGIDVPGPYLVSGAQDVPVASNPANGQHFDGSKPTQKPWTQRDQDHADNEAHHQAMDALVQIWNDRLSLVAIITTFFASTETAIISCALPADKSNASSIDQVSNASLTGALVVHFFSALVSFIAAFFLTRHKLRDAIKLELEIEHPSEAPSNVFSSSRTSILARNPRLVRVGFFNDQGPPIQLLRRCHALCIWLAAAGFVLALIGVVCFAWDKMPLSASIFSSVCMGVSVVFTVIAVLRSSKLMSKIMGL